MNNNMPPKNVLEYYERKFGCPDREAFFLSPEGKRIEIFKWSEGRTDEGVTIYATAGVSTIFDYDGMSYEFFLGLTPQADEVVFALAEVALHGLANERAPVFGDSMSLSYNLWPGTAAKTFLYTNGDGILSPTAVGFKSISFIQLVPLFDSELNYKKENGERSLWDKFEGLMVPYWSSRRDSAI
jgi:hypothetical protein